MGTSSLTAEDIALHQLLASMRLWHETDYLSALTLAGAAEEILGKRLKKCGMEPSFVRWRNLIVTLAKSEGETDPNIEKLVGDMLNSTRNTLKHFAGDEVIEIDVRKDCTEMIERAVSNHHQLTGIVLDEALNFWAAARGPS
ncbi:MAG: hypothetical protein Q8M80_01275 [Hydrogenophaga sp.]|uniref:hypothetical protein n=1 Tax=Hydrogenophaga sp. TaxID=1904254 RepID=UPI00271D1AAC|nr:hypothetical protein [Hydrogenophaga sp.]MDO9504126.1 hypothetical protein [Hydrogenophaga sp.]MDP3202680.1 hypothetical protein [Hydrogenophaga sp.]MDP3628785.1 hypothetical protein [Hydrogenophaga sp.]